MKLLGFAFLRKEIVCLERAFSISSPGFIITHKIFYFDDALHLLTGDSFNAYIRFTMAEQIWLLQAVSMVSFIAKLRKYAVTTRLYFCTSENKLNFYEKLFFNTFSTFSFLSDMIQIVSKNF